MQIQQFLHDKRNLFWTLQLGGWAGWAVTSYLGVAIWQSPPDNYLTYLLLVSGVGLLITLAMRSLYHATWESSPAWRALAILAGSFAGGATWMAFRSVVFMNFLYQADAQDHIAKEGFWGYFEGTSGAFMVMLVWSALYAGIKYYLLAQEEQQRRLKATAMAHQAQLKMLRYQLNPHFLFNTLNAISTLVLDQNTELANTMLTRLSRFLRYSLDNDPIKKVTVDTEVEALKLYLDIEKVRFEERLQLFFDIDPPARSALMPSLLLQPLVENAIKHAISTAIGGGSISVSAQVSGKQLVLAVADDGPGLEHGSNKPRKGGGVGLVNCRERLRELYGKEQSFRLGTTHPHGLTITIQIPLELESMQA
jgi:signal transduction histidine kinase